ncbi:MAG: hypothetical protein RIR62_1875 [Pseudomonadota bacterium]|jgi:hypothetical protein
MTIQFDPQAEFTARVERIRSGGEGTNRTLYVGMDNTFVVPKGFVAKRKARKGRIRGWLLTLALVGLAAFGATQAGVSVADMLLPLTGAVQPA